MNRAFKICGVLIFASILLGNACQKKNELLIPEDKMVNIIADLTIAENALRQYSAQSKDSIQVLLKETLLKVHNIDTNQLDTNLYLYQIDVVNYAEISKRVVDRLKQLQQEELDKQGNNKGTH